MTYAPINIDAYTNAYSGALAGMAISGWITDPTSTDYSNVATIVGAFAQAFDVVWNSATTLNWLQIQSIQSVCQEQFRGHAPGSLDNAVFTQASNWAVPAAACAALVLEGDAYIASQSISPITPGGSFGPIQNVRYLDELFTGTPNGSIAKPFKLFSEFYAGLGVISQGWELTLPGLLVTPDAPVPDVTTVSSITFQGIDRRTSQLAALAIANQTGNPTFVFRQLRLAAPAQLQIGDGSLNLDFEDVDIGVAIPTGTALVGTVRIVNSHFTFAIFAGVSGSTFTPAPSLEMYDGDITGQVSFSTAQFYNVVFGPGVIITPVTNGITRFIGCRFGAIVTIDNTATPTIEMDTYSHASFIAGGGVFAGTIIVVGTPKETLSIVVPAVLAGQVGYVTTAFAGQLAGLPADTPIVANPQADLVAAGAGGGFINARVSAAGSVRCAFLGPLAGGAVNFTFASLG